MGGRLEPAPAIKLNEEDRRLIAFWAADCAERALPLFEAKACSDTRAREAIECARVFARGGKRTAQLRTVAWAAYKAAGEVCDPCAAAAARSAGLAAAVAYMHAVVTPHQVKHALGPAAYAARACELAANDDSRVGDEGIRWAIEHASPAIRQLIRQMPSLSSGRGSGRRSGRGRLDALLDQLDTGLRR